ncbi:MAG: 5'/3'-nucleotidase SurE [Dehalococcoidia bacterium]|nr:5'/3'-nucleotidase SurE [Dehalococcoidia bacterium]
MNILLSNDDGIRAAGLWAAARELSKIGKVTVVAPDREQSGVGTSVTFHHPLRVKKEIPEAPGVDAYSVEGTPGDSVILALRLPLLREFPDLVISGINEGANLGDDVFISGTVGAALQGYFNGLSAISISVAAPKVEDFTPAAKLVALLAANLEHARLPGKILLNVNLPNVSLAGLQDLRVTKLAERRYADAIQEGTDGRKKYYWIGRGQTEWISGEGTDHWAIQHGVVSVTPLMASPRRPSRSTLNDLAIQVLKGLRKC